MGSIMPVNQAEFQVVSLLLRSLLLEKWKKKKEVGGHLMDSWAVSDYSLGTVVLLSGLEQPTAFPQDIESWLKSHPGSPSDPMPCH